MRRCYSHLVYGFILMASCKGQSDTDFMQTTETKMLEVTATAYNSTEAQTSGNPVITAWGDSLKPGMRAIAVSRDLIDMGLDHNTEVRIEGLEGTYLVKDKLHWRFKKRIDVYQGKDIEKAREWGIQKLIIYWEVPLSASPDSTTGTSFSE